MTITFTCGCGRQLAAADENAGQRVRCGACGGIQTVPGGAAAPRWVAEPAPMIRFACTDCGQTCQARPEFAGRNTRCPGCDRVLTIPSGTATVAEAVEASPRVPPFLQAERPLPRPLGRSRFEEDDGPEQDGDDLPRRRRSIKKKSRTWLWLGLTGTALVLCGGGLALWFLLRGVVSSDFDLVPRDAQGFVTVRVADLVKTPLGKKAMDKFQQELALPLRELQDKTGLGLADVERVTVVFVDVERQNLWIIVQTSRPLDRDKILKVAENPVERTHEGKKYFVKRDTALAFVSDRLMVLGPEQGIQRCLGLPKKPRSGPLDDALRAASKGKVQFAAGGHLPPELASQAKAGLEKQPEAKVWVDKLAPLFDIRTVYLTAAVGEDIDYELTLTFPDRAKAKKAEAVINDGLSMLRGLLPLGRMALQQQGMAAKEVDDALAQAQKGLEQMKPKQSGKEVSLAFKSSGSDLLKGLDNAKKQWNLLQQGGGFLPPGGQGFGPPPAGKMPRRQPFPQPPRGRGR